MQLTKSLPAAAYQIEDMVERRWTKELIRMKAFHNNNPINYFLSGFSSDLYTKWKLYKTWTAENKQFSCTNNKRKKAKQHVQLCLDWKKIII